MRLMLFGDGRWAELSLRRLLKEGHDFGGVILRRSQTDDSLASAAVDHGIDVLQPTSVNDPDFVARIAAARPDLNLSVSYDQILRRPIREVAPGGFVNFHAGKLPSYRGRNVLNWALINGETEIGLTAHFVDEGIDTGDIILQRTIPVGWTDTYGDVLDRAVEAFPDLVAETVTLVEEGRVQVLRQAHLPGTYFPARGEGDEWIDWGDPSVVVYNLIRAITRPGPGARTEREGEIVTIWRAAYDPSWPMYRATPGRVVARKPGEGVLVKTGDSTVLLQEVQVGAGGPRPPDWRIGTRLGSDPASVLRALTRRVAQLEARLDPRDPA